jgi:hypothetical protein
MTLGQWVDSQPVGEVTRIMKLTGLAYITVLGIRWGNRCRYDTAEKISKHVPACSIAELCTGVANKPKGKAKARPKAKRKRAAAKSGTHAEVTL